MKKINIKVIPNAKKAKVVEEDQRLKVYVNSPAVDGKANESVIRILAEHFGVRKSTVKIVRGHFLREKVIELS